MAPKHLKRSFAWELVLISVLLFLLAGVGPQLKREALAVQAALVAKAALAAVVAPGRATLALE